MAIIVQNTESRSHGWSVPPLKLKTSSLPTKINTQPKLKVAQRSSTCPFPSTTHKAASNPSLHHIQTVDLPRSLGTRPANAYGVDLDLPLPIISPLDIDDFGGHRTFYDTLANDRAEDYHMSDPEADDSSDSGSDLSDSSGRCTPFVDADTEEGAASLLPSLLLLHIDERASPSVLEPETARSHALTFRDLFFRSVPEDLKVVLGEASISHDPFLHTFDVALGKHSEGDAALRSWVDPYEREWYAQDQICSLSIDIAASAWGEDMNKARDVEDFFLWVLKWVQKYVDTLEEVRISVPDSFPFQMDFFNPNAPNFSSYDNDVQTLYMLQTLSWTGDTTALPMVLARYVPQSLHVLKIDSASLSIDDALLLISRISTYEIYTLEIGTLTEACTRSSQLTETDDMVLPLRLPYLDSLKVGSSIPLERFFAAISLPASLCKLEFDLSSVKAKNVGEVISSLIASEGLLWEGILFLDIEVEKAFEGMNEAMRRIKSKAAFAYVVFRGEVEP
ncbi:hypothetical protein BDN70DRAFT_204057 [Pholiota conissans]|uniref:Uncharacterized protein n=1 Tax=Pholiota conissans TaxID=109636 RepID=A0A9P6CR83_9AGAR|nr:hypothetical protein BDN70DRAFT_204057 [Pholiota conissans]